MGRQGFVVSVVVGVFCCTEPRAMERRSVVTRDRDACIVVTAGIG